MTYQEFDEKLQRLNELSPLRKAKLRDRWAKMSRRGPFFYVATRGPLVCAWLLACTWSGTTGLHNVSITRDVHLYEAVLPAFLFAGFLMPVLVYVAVRGTVLSFDKRDQRLRRHRKLTA